MRWRRRQSGAVLLGRSVGLLALLAHCARATPPVELSVSTDPSARFQDRYLASPDSPLDLVVDDSASSDGTGLARSIRIDATATALSESNGDSSSHFAENGVQLSAQWDTSSLGDWSADLAARDSSDARLNAGRGVMRLGVRGLPFDGGWSVDASAGDTNLPLLGIARQQNRFFLPAAASQGLSSDWHGPSSWEVVAAAGEPGIYNGMVVPTFQRLPGSTATLGAQWAPADDWLVGSQFVAAHGIDLLYGALPDGATIRESTNTALLSALWQTEATRAQLSVLDGAGDGQRNSSGAWVDFSTRHGGHSEAVGLFRIDPSLTWGNQIVSRDLQGAYFQTSIQTRRWFLDYGIDQAWSVSGTSPQTTYASADARYQWSRDWGTGGAINVRRAGTALAWSAQAYGDLKNDWGTGRGQLDYAIAPTEHGLSATFNQSWTIMPVLQLATSCGIEQISRDNEESVAAQLSLNAGGELSARLSIAANLRWDRPISGNIPSALTANMELNWQIARNWTLLANLYEVRMGSWTTIAVTSPLEPTQSTIYPASNTRSVFLTVRYQRSAGQHYAPLGGGFGSGSGELSGMIYLDANENGVFDAGELPASSVTVLLDGRYAATTDRNGRFDFPSVSAGHHSLRVIPDNLPLPWIIAKDGQVEVEVKTRGHATFYIPAVRHAMLTRQTTTEN